MKRDFTIFFIYTDNCYVFIRQSFVSSFATLSEKKTSVFFSRVLKGHLDGPIENYNFL